MTGLGFHGCMNIWLKVSLTRHHYNISYIYYNNSVIAVTLNVIGMNNCIKRSKLITKLKWGKKNLCCFLVGNTKQKKLEEISFSHHIEQERRGVAILISNFTFFKLISEHKDKKGRYV